MCRTALIAAHVSVLEAFADLIAKQGVLWMPYCTMEGWSQQYCPGWNRQPLTSYDGIRGR
jgi:hypothetical protein